MFINKGIPVLFHKINKFVIGNPLASHKFISELRFPFQKHYNLTLIMKDKMPIKYGK